MAGIYHIQGLLEMSNHILPKRNLGFIKASPSNISELWNKTKSKTHMGNTYTNKIKMSDSNNGSKISLNCGTFNGQSSKKIKLKARVPHALFVSVLCCFDPTG